MPDDLILDLLRASPKVARLCRQNGWIDNDSLRYDVVAQDPGALLVAVYFDEILVEGSGCVADIKSAYGRVRVMLDAQGLPTDLELT